MFNKIPKSRLNFSTECEKLENKKKVQKLEKFSIFRVEKQLSKSIKSDSFHQF